MSVLDAVIILANVIKQIVVDASFNSTMSASLTARVDIIPRILKKIPETSEVDVDLLNRMYGFLKEAHDEIVLYKNKGKMSRMLMASVTRARFAAVEENLGRCIDDLTFNLGVTSNVLLESIRNDMRKEGRDETAIAEVVPEAVPVVEEEEPMDFAGFEEITSHIENLSSAMKVFEVQDSSALDATSGAKLPTTSVVLYGDKIIVQNLRKVEEKKAVKKYAEEEDEGESDGFSSAAFTSISGAGEGTIVFHIDNTSSMLRERRMFLVKEVLKRVIPNFLRMGFRVIVNAWASTQENKGRVMTREVKLDAELLQVLHGGASAVTESAKEGAEGSQDVTGDGLIHQYLDKHVFDILEPKGRTDLYGSCFQLIRQCRTLLGSSSAVSGPVHAFVLTDGEHNLLNAPLHVPTREGEDYFGVFASKPSANKQYYKFEKTGADPSVPMCEHFLRKELDSVNGGAQQARLTVTFVGIGDAETQPLSDLTQTMGEQCSFYGITEVSQCDEVFRNISAGTSEISVVGDDTSGTSGAKVALKFTYEDESSGCLVTHGAAARLEDHFVVQTLHGRTTLSVLQPSAAGDNALRLEALVEAAGADSVKSKGSTATEYTSNKITAEELHRRVAEFVSEIRRLRDSAYEVDAQSFGTVFRQLMADKKTLQAIKNSFLSKHTRRLRQFALFSGLGVWLRELEELIESQIASYRMNVESEILNKIALPGAASPASGAASGKNATGAGGNYLQPTQLVLFRLQNNMSNAGKSTHRVVRHVAAISSIRDRTMHIAGTLFSTSLSLQYLYAPANLPGQEAVHSDLPSGVRLAVQRAATAENEGKSFHVDWTVSANPTVDPFEQAQMIYDSVLDVADALAENKTNETDSVTTEDAYDRYSYLLAGLSSSINKRAFPRNPAGLPAIAIDSAVVFPCIALSAKFDPFTIVRSTYVFFTTDVLCSESSGELEAKVFCAQELWELCHASNHTVGEPLPISSAGGSVNMILPLAHTPLLFALYVERGRAYHSAVNVTADCMALTVVSMQWAKFFHDALFLTLGVGRAREPERVRVFVRESLKAVMGLHYSINSAVMLPSVAGLNKLFAFDAAQAEIVTENVVISREDCAGITCSIAVAALVAGGHLPYADSANSWNILLRTLFSRLAEAISGHKVVRMAAPAVAKTPAAASMSDIDGDAEDAEGAPEAQKDPGALENDYRLKLGELQGLLRKRLHVEWAKSTPEEKRVQVRADAEAILACLQSIVELFLNKLDTHGLQSWAQASGLVVQALLLKNYGIEQLKKEFNEFASLFALERIVVETGRLHLVHRLALPVCERNAEGVLVLREATVQDVDHLIMYIDALVATKAGPKVEYKPILNPNYPVYSAAENRAESFKHSTVQWDESLPSANIAFIGNVNSGKSSISGILLTCMQIVPEYVVARLGQKAVQLGLPESLKHAWVMDTTSHERAGGFTVQPTWAGFQTPSRRYTIIDNPGHKDFSRNAAFGVFEADFVVLVMPANMLTEETAQHTHQAEEHLMTAFCFGVRELVVAVNKMDLVGYSQEAFESVRAYTLKIMKKAGFKPEGATFVPVSVTDGEGFLSVSDKVASWYSGPCLLQACDELPAPRRVADKPLRMVIDEVFHKGSGKKDSAKPVIVVGRVERGMVSVNDEVNLSPAGLQRARVLSIQLHGGAISQGRPGDIIGVSLQPSKVAAGTIGAPHVPCKGMIMTLYGQPSATVMNKFEVQLLVVKGTAFKVGYKPAMTTHIVTVPVIITRMVEIIGRNNTVVETNPAAAKAGQTLVCEMQSVIPFAAETIHDMPRLSRFLIKEERAISAIGFIRRVIC